MEHGASCTCDTCMEKDERLYTVWHDEKDDPLAWLDEPLTDEERERAGLPLAGE